MKALMLVLLTCLVLASSAPLLAGTIYVDDDNTGGPWDGSQANPYQYIQEGIDAADPGDTVIVKDGTYTGPWNRNLGFGGKAITVESENGADVTIDCEHDGRAFCFDNGETDETVVDGFTIKNGSATWGGGIRCSHSSPHYQELYNHCQLDLWPGGRCVLRRRRQTDDQRLRDHRQLSRRRRRDLLRR